MLTYCNLKLQCNTHRVLTVNCKEPAGSSVQAKYKNTNATNRDSVAKWGKYYEGSARWEAFFLFIFEGLQEATNLTEAQKLGSEFMKLAS